jgi:hypothetical protein
VLFFWVFNPAPVNEWRPSLAQEGANFQRVVCDRGLLFFRKLISYGRVFINDPTRRFDPRHSLFAVSYTAYILLRQRRSVNAIAAAGLLCFSLLEVFDFLDLVIGVSLMLFLQVCLGMPTNTYFSKLKQLG